MKYSIGLVAILVALWGVVNAQNDSLKASPGNQEFGNSQTNAANRIRGMFSLGLETGYTLNYLITNISSLTDTEYQPIGGFSVAIPVAYALTDWWSLYSDPNLTKKNYEYERTGSFQGVNETYTNTYLQLPFMARFQYGGKKLKGFVNPGFYGGYWLSGRVKGTMPNPLNPVTTGSTSGTSIFDGLNPYSFNEKYAFNSTKDNRWEFGWILGAGASYQLNSTFQLFVEGRITQSLTDQQKQYMTNQVQRYNQTIGISAGCLVNLKALSK